MSWFGQKKVNGEYSGLVASELHDETTFYQTFLKDLENCQYEVIIESPFITKERMRTFDRIFKKLLDGGVKIYILTRDPKEHSSNMEVQSEEAIKWCEHIGIQVLICKGNHHRKVAILDRRMLWEGSLNILSQSQSREIMRRINGENSAFQMFEFLNLGKII